METRVWDAVVRGSRRGDRAGKPRALRLFGLVRRERLARGFGRRGRRAERLKQGLDLVTQLRVPGFHFTDQALRRHPQGAA